MMLSGRASAVVTVVHGAPSHCATNSPILSGADSTADESAELESEDDRELLPPRVSSTTTAITTTTATIPTTTSGRRDRSGDDEGAGGDPIGGPHEPDGSLTSSYLRHPPTASPTRASLRRKAIRRRGLVLRLRAHLLRELAVLG